jgi:hypothetical protein
MMPLDVLAVICIACAALPAWLTLSNLLRFRRPPLPGGGPPPSVSVLIPARDEERAIGRTVSAALASTGVDLEVVVLDDESRDATASIVTTIAAADPRVRLVKGRPLPPGWCGKQHACALLADEARHEHLVFIDADVTLMPECLARSVAFLRESGAALASGFPRQETGTFFEWLLLPLIHFVLLGYLPLGRSRRSLAPGLAAGCGQLFVTRISDYRTSGGHGAIRESLHDGIKLPRAYRRAGLATDIFDATGLANCRMYERDIDVLKGLSKNATEGMASPRVVLPASVLLLFGQVMPVVLLAIGIATGWSGFSTRAAWAVVAASALSYLPRLLEAIRFRQSLASALAHPLGIAVFLVIQWVGVFRKALGLNTSWKGRSLAPQN